jgi:hypothetical protein
MPGTSVPSLFEKDPAKLREAAGITQFLPSDINSYYHSFSGVLIQGGFKTSPGAGFVPYQASFPKQVLGVFMNGAVASAVSLNGFTASGPGYWFAIGI